MAKNCYTIRLLATLAELPQKDAIGASPHDQLDDAVDVHCISICSKATTLVVH